MWQKGVRKRDESLQRRMLEFTCIWKSKYLLWISGYPIFSDIYQVYNYVVRREVHFEKHKSTFHISQMAPLCTLIIHWSLVMYGSGSCTLWNGKKMSAFELWLCRQWLSIMDWKKNQFVSSELNKNWLLTWDNNQQTETWMFWHTMQADVELEQATMFDEVERNQKKVGNG